MRLYSSNVQSIKRNPILFSNPKKEEKLLRKINSIPDFSREKSYRNGSCTIVEHNRHRSLANLIGQNYSIDASRVAKRRCRNRRYACAARFFCYSTLPPLLVKATDVHRKIHREKTAIENSTRNPACCPRFFNRRADEERAKEEKERRRGGGKREERRLEMS